MTPSLRTPPGRGTPALRKVLTTQWLKSQAQLVHHAAADPTTPEHVHGDPSRTVDSEASKKYTDGAKSDLASAFSPPAAAWPDSGVRPRRRSGAAALATPPVPEVSSSGHVSCHVVPRWRCFIKSVTVTHLMLSFVPASFDDLRLLVQGSGIVQFTQEPRETDDAKDSKERKSTESSGSYLDVDGVEYVQKVRKVHVSGNKVSVSELPKQAEEEEEVFSGTRDEATAPEEEETPDAAAAVAAQEDAPECHDHHGNSDEAESPEGEAAESAAPDTYTSLVLPVYTYNCPLSCLTDQLVNKWTFKSDADIYQDLTFASEEKAAEEEAKKEEVRAAQSSCCRKF